MTRIQKTFADLKSKNQKAFTAFITAGDPSLEHTLKIILALEKAGVNIIELGVPFSDPMADGPTIQKSYERALVKGATLKRVLALVNEARKHTQVPIVLMGYYNPIYQMGLETFAKQCKKVGVDGTIIVDLPVEEATALNQELKKQNVDHIHLLSPLSPDERIQAVQKQGSGFVYYVSYTGTTGANKLNASEIKKKVAHIKKQITHPVQIGFGISKPEHVKALSPYADGVVVGSEIIKTIEKNHRQRGWLKGLEEKVKRLVAAKN